MNKDPNAEKQIEEMAKNVCHLDRTCDECMTSFECKAMMYAKRFYAAGYRKASEVAGEIFEEVGELINEYLDGRSYRHEFITKVAELKKKYIGKDTNVGGKTEET